LEGDLLFRGERKERTRMGQNHNVDQYRADAGDIDDVYELVVGKVIRSCRGIPALREGGNR